MEQNQLPSRLGAEGVSCSIFYVLVACFLQSNGSTGRSFLVADYYGEFDGLLFSVQTKESGADTSSCVMIIFQEWASPQESIRMHVCQDG
jgi:hypothetical protein